MSARTTISERGNRKRLGAATVMAAMTKALEKLRAQ